MLKDVNDIDPLEMYKYVKVFVNGDWIGSNKRYIWIVQILKLKKMKMILIENIIIYLNYQKKELNIYTDGGRMFRPVLKVNNNRLVLNKNVLMKLNSN